MNKAITKSMKNIATQKKKYLFLIVITLIGILSGIIFIFFISNVDKLLIKDELNTFLLNIKNNNLDYYSSFFQSFSSNFIYLIIIWLLGISIIGIPIIIFLLFFKGFIFGFGISSMISNFGLKGIGLSLGYQSPHLLIMLLIFLLISFYAINFSVKLFRILFLKDNINLSPYFKKYIQILIISLVFSLICSIMETFLSPILINLFL